MLISLIWYGSRLVPDAYTCTIQLSQRRLMQCCAVRHLLARVDTTRKYAKDIDIGSSSYRYFWGK